MISFLCPVCESPGAHRLDELRRLYCSSNQRPIPMAYCHECGTWISPYEEPIMAEQEIKRAEPEQGLEWRPYCSDCRAQLMPKQGQASCVLCHKTWNLQDIEAEIVELEERPPMPTTPDLDITLPVIDEEDGVDLNWVSDPVQLASAEVMYQAWVDEYHKEPNADRNLSIQAATKFLAQLLAEQHQSASQQGITNTFPRWRAVAMSHYEESLKRMQASRQA